MSTTSQPKTFSDLVADLVSRARVDASQTVNPIYAKKLINSALADMALGNGEKFPWLHRRERLLVNGSYTTGTLSITQGATSVIGVGTLWDTASVTGVDNVRPGGKLRLPGSDISYEVQSVTNDTTLVLTDAYLGETLAGESYTYYEDEYTLASDFLKPLQKTTFDRHGRIEIVDRSRFEAAYTRWSAPGRIQRCTIFTIGSGTSVTQLRRVAFWRAPDVATYVPYSYVTSNVGVSAAGVETDTLVNDADEPLAPLQTRHIIVSKGLEQWYRDKKNDTRSAEAKAEYVEGMQRMQLDVDVGQRQPVFKPDVSSYVRAARQPYRGRGGRRYTLGTAFDEMKE